MPEDEAGPVAARSEAACLTITLVGVMPDDAMDRVRLTAVGEAILAAVQAQFPGFVPGYPPFAVAFVTLPELRDADGG